METLLVNAGTMAHMSSPKPLVGEILESDFVMNRVMESMLQME